MTSSPTVPQLLRAAYLMVLLALFFKSALDLFRLGAVRRNSLEVPTELLDRYHQLRNQFQVSATTVLRLSNRVGSALTAGIIRPFIVLPIGLVNQLDPNEMEAILLHELAHVARRDHLWNALQNTLLQLFFYHPLIHWLSRRIDREREYACDDLVIGRVEPQLYANSLLRAARFSVTQKNQFIVQAQGKTHFTQRIQRLFAPQTPRRKQRWLLLPILLLPLLLTAVLTAQQSQPEVVEEIVEQPQASPNLEASDFRTRAIQNLRDAIPEEAAESTVFFFNDQRYAAFDDFTHLFGNNLYSEACDCDEELQRINAEEGTNYTSIRRYYSEGVPVDELDLEPGETRVFEGFALADPNLIVEESEPENLAMFIDEVPVYEEAGSGDLVTITAETATIYEREHPIAKLAREQTGVDYDGAIVMETAHAGEEITENATAAISFNDTILVVVNGKPYEDRAILNQIDPGDIATINVLKGNSMLKRYGDRYSAYKGVIKVQLKPGVTLAGLDEVEVVESVASDPGERLLYIINDEIYSYDKTVLTQLDPETIESVNVEKRQSEMTEYELDVTGIVRVKLKPGYDANELLPHLAEDNDDGVEDMFGTDNVLFYVDGKIAENLNFKALKKKGVESVKVIKDKEQLKELKAEQYDAVVKILTYKSKEAKKDASHKIEIKKKDRDRKQRKSSGN